MHMIEAVIKPQKLDAVKSALAKIGILGVTASEVKGYGRQAGHTERYRGAKMDVGFVPKILLTICVKSAPLRLLPTNRLTSFISIEYGTEIMRPAFTLSGNG